VLDESKYHDIAVYIYSIIQDYHKNKIDVVCDEDVIDKLEHIICEQDPDWALAEIKGTKRCDRCSNVFLSYEIHSIRVKDGKNHFVLDWYCEDCMCAVKNMLDIYHTDDSSSSESESDDSEKANLDDEEAEIEYLNRCELQDEIARGR
jgi:hypothetical protein